MYHEERQSHTEITYDRHEDPTPGDKLLPVPVTLSVDGSHGRVSGIW